MLSSQINVQNDPPKFVLCSGVTYLAWQGAVGGAGWRGDVDRRPGLVTWATLPWRLGLQLHVTALCLQINISYGMNLPLKLNFMCF